VRDLTQVDWQRLGGGVQIGSLDGTEPGDTGGATSRASDNCCLGEVDSSKTLLVGVGERGILRKVVKGWKDGMLNLLTLWNS
jgi:hypothetical protein